MPEIIEPACETLLSEPDNIEIIRDQIAALLAVDFAHQAELAAEAGVRSRRDYDVAVYVENEIRCSTWMMKSRKVILSRV